MAHKTIYEDLEKQNKKSDTKFINLLNSSTVGIYQTNIKGDIIYVNEAMAEIYEYKVVKEMLLKNAIAINKNSEDREVFIQALKKSGSVEKFESEVITKSGKTINTLTSAILEKDTISGVVIDITKYKVAEEKIQSGEKKYRLLENSIPGISFKGYKDWSVEFADNKIEQLTGYDMQKYNSGSMKWIDLMVADDIETARQIFIRALKTNKSYVRDYRIKTKSKDILWIQERGQIVCDDKGNIEHVSGSFYDITEAKKAAMALKKEKERSQQYLDIAGVMFVAIDAKQNVTMINKKGCEILGYEEHEIVGKNWFSNFIKAENIENIKEVFNKGISGNIELVEYYENPVLTKDGGKKMIAWHNSIISDESGRIIGVLCAGDDITDRKRIEISLKKSKEKYRRMYNLMRLMTDNIPDMIWAKDMDGRYMFANQTMCDKLVMSDYPDGVIGMTDTDIGEKEKNAGYECTFGELCVNADAIVKERKVACRIIDEGFVRNKYLVLDFHMAPFLNENREVVGTVGSGRDVTTEKEIEKALKEREIELEGKNTKLMEMNSALKVLLEKRDGDKKLLEEKIMENINNLIMPYLVQLNKTTLNYRQDILLEIIRRKIEDILSPFAHKLSHKYLKFTPTELKVADLVKQGLRTKEIADILISSPETISGHRKNMRKKLNLKDKKSNLRTHLLSLANGYN